ncbi:polysaccharide deacetylase family protein [Solwaraspora sp. WMMB762]|uniref:polysaccharide deacetylase family protein n=1 Tax=Solwaraspora sp. WMMB762 TaxID=3404120 RepID=UPI003B95D531
MSKRTVSKRAMVAAGLAVFALLVGSESIAALRGARQVPAQVPATAALGAAPDRPVPPPEPVPSPGPRDPVPAPTADPGDQPPSSAVTSGSPGASARPAVDERLLQRRTGGRQVALTFDDGPHPKWTPLILDELRAAGARATFCVVGAQVRRYPALVVRMVREGHTLCNHTWSHELDLGSQSPDEIRANLLRTNKEIHKVVPGVPIELFRHPGGLWTPKVVTVVEELGMVPLDWDVDPQDWRKPTKEKLVSQVTAEVRLGSIILLHDGGGDRSATVAALPAVVHELRQRYGITLLGASLSP